MTKRPTKSKAAGRTGKSARRSLPPPDDEEVQGRQRFDVFDKATFRELDEAVPGKRKNKSVADLEANLDRYFDVIEMRDAAAEALNVGVRAKDEAEKNAAAFDRSERDFKAVRRVIGPRVVWGRDERRRAALGMDVEPFDVGDVEYHAFGKTLEILERRMEESRPPAGNTNVFKQAFVRHLATAWRQHVGEPGRGKSGPFVQFVEAAWRLHQLPAEELDSLGPFIRGLAERENWVGSRP